MSTTPTSQTSESETTNDARADPPALEFRRLTHHCARARFCCGHNEIDDWFRRQSHDDHEALACRVTTVHLIDNPDPVGFYAMTTRLQRVSEFAQYAPAGSRQQGGYLTTVQLSWVAVMRECQRRGFGTVMMGAALRDFYEIVIRAGVCAMTLQAIDLRVL